MAPKKRPHGKDVTSSSSTPPHFDRRKFWNADAENFYTTLLGKNMHRERGVDISLSTNAFIIRAQNRQWLKFVEQPGPAVKDVVREFYANLMVKHDDYRVKVRGKMVAFDRKTINAIYEMPDYEVDGYRLLMGGTVPYDEILALLCFPGATWKLNNEGKVVNFESKYLREPAYRWFVFMASRIIPSNHTSEVTKERAALLYCIFTDRDIDIGRFVQDSILHSVHGGTTLSMPHTSVITELCRHAGVVWDENEELLQPRNKIEIMQRKTNRRGPIAQGLAEDVHVPLQMPHASPPRQEPTMDERLMAIERNLDQQRQDFEAHRRQAEEHWQYSREHMMYMQQFNYALSQRFPTSSADYMPFPQPPSWPSQSRNVEDDDVDMGPGGGNEY